MPKGIFGRLLVARSGFANAVAQDTEMGSGHHADEDQAIEIRAVRPRRVTVPLRPVRERPDRLHTVEFRSARQPLTLA